MGRQAVQEAAGISGAALRAQLHSALCPPSSGQCGRRASACPWREWLCRWQEPETGMGVRITCCRDQTESRPPRCGSQTAAPCQFWGVEAPLSFSSGQPALSSECEWLCGINPLSKAPVLHTPCALAHTRGPRRPSTSVHPAAKGSALTFTEFSCKCPLAITRDLTIQM